jgi:hypothetical protein
VVIVRTGYRESCHEGNDDTSRAEVVDIDDAEPKLTPSVFPFCPDMNRKLGGGGWDALGLGISRQSRDQLLKKSRWAETVALAERQ